MVSCAKKHEDVLKVLAKAKPDLVRSIIKPAKKSLIDFFSECAFNILRGSVPITSVQRKKLKRYVRGLRKLARKKTSVKERKKILQTGGIVPLILKHILPMVVSPLLNKIIT